ncbi:hypothetical protein ACFDTO_01195 [Microbacteriaceae bacterium 4G12]
MLVGGAVLVVALIGFLLALALDANRDWIDPITAVCSVLGAALTAIATFAALFAARDSRETSRQARQLSVASLRSEESNLTAERRWLERPADADAGSGGRRSALPTDGGKRPRLDEIDERLAQIRRALGEGD